MQLAIIITLAVSASTITNRTVVAYSRVIARPRTVIDGCSVEIICESIVADLLGSSALMTSIDLVFLPLNASTSVIISSYDPTGSSIVTDTTIYAMSLQANSTAIRATTRIPKFHKELGGYQCHFTGHATNNSLRRSEWMLIPDHFGSEIYPFLEAIDDNNPVVLLSNTSTGSGRTPVILLRCETATCAQEVELQIYVNEELVQDSIFKGTIQKDVQFFHNNNTFRHSVAATIDTTRLTCERAVLTFVCRSGGGTTSNRIKVRSHDGLLLPSSLSAGSALSGSFHCLVALSLISHFL